MQMFRGITVSQNDVDQVISTIQSSGLNFGDGCWQIVMPNLQKHLHSHHWDKLVSDMQYRETNFPKVNWMEGVFACSDRDSALFYADVHHRTNEKSVPLIIEFSVLEKDVLLDSRDFLETAFGLWKYYSNSKTKNQKIASIMVDLFGRSLSPYVQALYRIPEENISSRIKLVQLALNDNHVIYEHSINCTWIHGRHNTFFRNAFCIRTPVLPSKITKVYVPQDRFSEPVEWIHLHDVIH